MHYLDNAATTRVADAVADTADAVLRAHYANPSSLYAPGAQSEFVLSGARETVAASLGAQPGEIVFTACGSEGNNLAVLGAVKARAAWAARKAENPKSAAFGAAIAPPDAATVTAAIAACTAQPGSTPC